MEIVSLKQVGIEAAASDAAAVLRGGGVVLFPTDTLHGLGADAFSDNVVAKIYAIKGRDEKKPIHAIVADLEMAAEYGVIDDVVRRLSERLPKGKVTFIVKKRPGVSGGIASGIETFGFRIPDNEFCIALSRAYGAPYTATSANRAGEKPARSVAEIVRQLGGDAGIELAIDAGGLHESEPSTVVDVSDGEVRILREGPITQEEINRELGL